MFGWEFPPHILGGLGTASYGLTQGMWECGDMDITFVIPKPWGDEDRSFAHIIGASQVPVAWRDVSRDYVESASDASWPRPLLPLRDHIYADFNYMRTNDLGCIEFSGRYPDNLLEEINNYCIMAGVVARTVDCDIIHSHDWLTYPAGIHAKQVTGKPLVIHVHATDYDRSRGNVNPTVFGIERDGMIHADHIITVSNLTRQTVIEKYGIDPAKVTTVHNAVVPLSQELLDVQVQKPKEKVVTFLGRITMQKGPEYFVEAAAKVLRNNHNVRFVMAGSGDMMDKMILLAAERGIADRFHFPGFQKGKQVYEMLKASDVYIMPCVSEPFGISPLEAMQMGVPCIISKQSGCAEILTNVIKTDYWDIDAMADAIHSIVTYPAMYNQLREDGLAEVNADHLGQGRTEGHRHLQQSSQPLTSHTPYDNESHLLQLRDPSADAPQALPLLRHRQRPLLLRRLPQRRNRKPCGPQQLHPRRRDPPAHDRGDQGRVPLLLQHQRRRPRAARAVCARVHRPARKLADTGAVEFLAVPYAHSLASLADPEEFAQQVKVEVDKLHNLLGVKPKVLRNTELIYDDEIAPQILDMGYKGVLTEGAKHILGWKSPNYVYSAASAPKVRLLLKNDKLSDDIAARFSDTSWDEYPLTADKYIAWIASTPAEEQVVNICLNLETFGGFHTANTGIFQFLEALPRFAAERGIEFRTPSQVLSVLKPVGELSVMHPISGADEARDVSAWLGNSLQNEAFSKLYSVAERVRLCDDRRLKQDWYYLQGSDHFFYMCTKHFADGAAHSMFSPYETPFQAFTNYMNVLADFIVRVEEQYP